MVQNSPKVTKKVLVFRKVARSCSLTKKLLKILKFAKKLLSRIWKGTTPKELKTERDCSHRQLFRPLGARQYGVTTRENSDEKYPRTLI